MDCQGPNVSYFRLKTLMTHCGLQRFQGFLFQAENFDGALWIAKDQCFLFQAENFDDALWIAKNPPNGSYFRQKTLMTHYGLPRTQCFLFQAENFDGALWIAKDPSNGSYFRQKTLMTHYGLPRTHPTVLISGRKL